MGNHIYSASKATAGKPVLSLDEWVAIIESQKTSGMSRTDWCNKHGYSAGAMRAAERRLSRRASVAHPLEWTELISENESVEDVPAKEDSSWGVRISCGDLVIKAHAKYPAEKLAVLVGRLARPC
jgi:creatinine amidohydrolase/Fe(II)-dependent formamide hydrolase-like protein